ncbi:hypothetical protein [Chromobacterium subtsugae]|uniref:hypothetical protein n=1 Tax=Chromobacterium subtsugae TaxID=251747 RepID=UPI000640FDCA|nr:hypothetical protein [Chromobacterium subtsugae]
MSNDLITGATGRIPLRWVDEIFRRLMGRFGAQFADKYRSGVIVDQRTGKTLQPTDDMTYAVDAGVEEAKQVWAEELDLSRITPDQIKSGLQVRYQYPPSCDEFIRGCHGGNGADRDPEALFYRAQAEMGNRRARKPQNWPSPPLFWAAVSLGNDLLHSDYRSMKGRWIAALDANRDRMADVPEVRNDAALPATMSREEAEVQIAQVHRAAKSMRFPSDNAHRLDNWLAIADEVARGVYKGGTLGKQHAAAALKKAGHAVPDSLIPYLPESTEQSA